MDGLLGAPSFLAGERGVDEGAELGMIEWLAIRRSPLYYCERYALTQDEAVAAGEGVVRPLLHGDYAVDAVTLELMRELDGREDDYLRFAIMKMDSEQLVATPKSRQIRASHTFLAYIAWWCLTKPGQKWAVISKKEKDADALLTRVDRSLEEVRKAHSSVPWPVPKYTKSNMVFPNTSHIMALASGSDQLRSYTFSGIFSDEQAFHDEAEEEYTGALPTISSGGKLFAVSSVYAGTLFDKVVHDQL